MQNFVYIYTIIGLLPGLEFSLRLGGPPWAEEPENSATSFYFVDRMISAKWNFLKEKEIIPSVAIGLQDMIGQEGFKKFNSLYLVAGKNFILHKRNLEVNLGVGTNLYDKIASKSRETRFKGIFGNITYDVIPNFKFQTEYDTRTINFGFQYLYKDLLKFDAFLTDYKFPGASAIISFKF